VISSLFMVGVTFIPGSQERMTKVFKFLNRELRAVDHEIERVKIQQETEVTSGQAAPEVSKADIPKSSNSIIDSKSDSSVKSAQQDYVYIEGKYYKERADNIYIINGRKVFYINKRKDLGSAEAASVTSANISPGEK
jgi:hypothetical protein